jgi:hypothetical protein
MTVDATCPRCGHDKALPTPGAHVVRCEKCGKNFNPAIEARSLLDAERRNQLTRPKN